MAHFNYMPFLATTILLLDYVYGLQFQGNTITQNAGKNDFLIGGYFGVHRRGTNTNCGEIDQESGVYLVEAMRYAIQKINSEPSNLFNVTLGYRIVDTCSSIPVLRDDIAKMILTGRTFGVVGPATSDEAILAAPAFGIFHRLLISYSATNIDLQDRSKYFNFYRTVPADDIQSLALRDTLKHFNWTYVSTVNSYGDYGQGGMERLIGLARSSGICIATRNTLPKIPNASDYEHVIRNLNKDPNARTVVLYTTAEDTRNILIAARSSKVNFTWLSSTAWTADLETVRGIEKDAKGAILLNYVGINNAKFYKHFMSLKYEDNKYKWFKEFWENAFNCSLDAVAKRKRCYGNESIADSNFYGKYAAGQAVIDAVNAYAYALRCTLSHFCKMSGANKTRCAYNLRSSSIIQGMRFFIRKRPKRCSDIFGRVTFDENGTFHRDIEILNFDGQTYHSIGIWKWDAAAKTSKIVARNGTISWRGNMARVPLSICSQPCKAGARMVKSKLKDCCFTCHPCQGDEILFNNTCVKCLRYELPDSNQTKCIKLEKLEVKIANYLSVIVLAESVIGFTLNSFVLYLFIKHKDSKIVKSSSRELSFFMLAGLYLCFISPCIFLLHPTVTRCGLRRFIFGLSLTACYTPLMLKTNRIYRIFRAARVMVSMPYLVSPRSQIFICFGLLALQLLLSIMWVVGDPPVVTRVVVHEYKMVAELCGADILTIVINLIPCFCMLAASTVYAFKSRKFPKNYNEAYNIGVTMYVSCVLWAIFIPLLLFVEVQTTNPFSQIFVIGNFTNVIGLISLAGLFGPKVRRLVFYNMAEPPKEMYSSAYNKSNSVNKSLDNSIDMSVIMTIDNDIKEPSSAAFVFRKVSRRKSI